MGAQAKRTQAPVICDSWRPEPFGATAISGATLSTETGPMDLRECEALPLPWRHVPLPFDDGGMNRVAYLIIAANNVEVCIVSDRSIAEFVCATSDLERRPSQ